MSYASTNTTINSRTHYYTTQEALDRSYSRSIEPELSGYAYGNMPLSSGSTQRSPTSSHWQQEDLPSFQDFGYNDNENNFSSSSSSSVSSLPSFDPQTSAFFFTPFNEDYSTSTQPSINSEMQMGYEYEDWGMSVAEIDAEFGQSIWKMAWQMAQGMETVEDEIAEEKNKEADAMQVENELDLQQSELLSAAAREGNASQFEVSEDSDNHATPPREASPTTTQGSVSESPAIDPDLPPAKPKIYKCQKTPGCTKEYSSPNGLKYHLVQGTCIFVPKKPRPPPKTKAQAKLKTLQRTELKAKEAGKVNEKRKAKGKGKCKATDTNESSSSSGSSPDSSSTPSSLLSSSSSSLSPLGDLPFYRPLLPMPLPGNILPDVTSQAASTTYPPSAPPLMKIPFPVTAYHTASSSTPHFDLEHNSLQESTPRSSLLFRSALNTVPTFGTTQARDTVVSLSSSRPSPPSAQVSFAQQSVSWPMHETSTSPLSPILLPLLNPQASTTRVPQSAPTSGTPNHQYRPMNPIFNAPPQQTPNTQMQAQNISQNTSQMSQLVVDVTRRTETSARREMVPASTSASLEQQGHRRVRPPTQIARPSATLPALVNPHTFSVPLSRPAPSDTPYYISRSLDSSTTILPPVAVPDPEAFAGLMEETERLKAIEARGTFERERLENHYAKLMGNYDRFRH